MLAQSGPSIAALITRVTHAWPLLIASAISLRFTVGITHETEGSPPLAAASKYSVLGVTRSIYPDASIVEKPGNGFWAGTVTPGGRSAGHGRAVHEPSPT